MQGKIMASAWEIDNTRPTHARRSEIKPTLQSNWKVGLKHSKGREFTPSADDSYFLPGLSRLAQWANAASQANDRNLKANWLTAVTPPFFFVFFHQNFEILRDITSSVFLYRSHLCVQLSIENTHTNVHI